MNRRRLLPAACVSICIALAGPPTTCVAEPFIPADDNEVLESLPRELLASQDELGSLRRQLAKTPENAQLAEQVATRYLQIGKQESDPRYYGYARAALHPWWDSKSPLPGVLQLRAELKERDHQYDKALADLHLLLQKQPRNVQAWIEIGNILRVQGKYAAAREACNDLSEFADSVSIMVCNVPLLAATGHAEAGYKMLGDKLPEVRQNYPGTVQWVLTMQADVARSLGRDELAEQHYRDGLANNSQDNYLIRSYADFLLDRDRAEEALTLVRDHTKDIGILLRGAIAARRCGEEQLANQWQDRLAAHFREVRLRGSQPHGRYEARYALELLDDPQLALKLALANWQKQKEMRDTRNLLEAAIATNKLAAADRPAAARPAIAFLKKSGNEDVELNRLVQRLEEK